MSTTLILGASRGIGLEFVRQHLEAGDTVIATGRDEVSIEKLQQMGATATALDVTDAASVERLGAQIKGVAVDLAVYVAGVFGPREGARAAPSPQDFDRVMHANVLGAMQLIPVVAPRVEAAPGTFVFVTSGLGCITEASSSHGWLYRASKAALNMAVKSASFDYPKAKLVAISPGWVRTDMGGAGATLSVSESVTGMTRALASLGPNESGVFLDQNAKRLPW